MRERRPAHPTRLLLISLAVACSSACASNTTASGSSRGGGSDAGRPRGRDAAAAPLADAALAEDPPARLCLPDGGSVTSDDVRPPDTHLEGSPCDHVGETAACWPGLRADRARGVCHDGTATCMPVGEFGGAWGPCEGARLPADGATRGAEACNCFSAGHWDVDNIAPCFWDFGDGALHAVSTFMDAAGVPQCPTTEAAGPPARPEPGTVWSRNRLTVDCAGSFRLCYTIRAGNAEAPTPGDCVVSRSCTDVWYAEPGTMQELPPLPSWAGDDTACSQRFWDSGGYGEMSVLGTSVECEPVDDGAGAEYVFGRTPYCSMRCGYEPTLPECEGCTNGDSGAF